MYVSHMEERCRVVTCECFSYGYFCIYLLYALTDER